MAPGRCLAYGDGVAFWALAEMVRMPAGILEDEENATALPKLHAALEEHIPDADERRFVEPRLAQLLGIEPGGHGDQENLFSAWRIFFSASPTRRRRSWYSRTFIGPSPCSTSSSTCSTGPVTTDLHPHHCAPGAAGAPPTWGAAKRSFTSLFLEPLTGPQLERLLRAP